MTKLALKKSAFSELFSMFSCLSVGPSEQNLIQSLCLFDKVLAKLSDLYPIIRRKFRIVSLDAQKRTQNKQNQPLCRCGFVGQPLAALFSKKTGS